MTCQNCGRQTTGRASLCRFCIRDTNRDDTPPALDDEPECPSCGGTTSADDVECYRCRDTDTGQGVAHE